MFNLKYPINKCENVEKHLEKFPLNNQRCKSCRCSSAAAAAPAAAAADGPEAIGAPWGRPTVHLKFRDRKINATTKNRCIYIYK